MSEIVLIQVDNEYRADSREIAERLGIQHESFINTLTKYAEELQRLGVFRFQIGKPQTPSGGRPERYALLNEDQAVKEYLGRNCVLI